MSKFKRPFNIFVLLSSYVLSSFSMKIIQRYILILLLFTSLYSKAQIELGIGPQLNFPLMYNNMVGDYHHSLGSVGPRFTINYVPNTTSFYPSLSANIASAIVPLLKVNSTVISMRFIQANISLSARGKRPFKKGELNYGIGLGASYFSGESIETSGNDNNSTNLYNVANDSNFISMWMPAVNLGVEYVIPISTKRPWFAGFGFNLQYIHFFDRDIKYAISVFDNNNWTRYQVNLKGELFTPGCYISFYYKLGQNAYNY